LATTDTAGVSVAHRLAEAMQRLPFRSAGVSFPYAAYLEAHIEQGRS